MHDHQEDVYTDPASWLVWLPIMLAAILYVCAAHRKTTGRPWNHGRTAAFLAGLALLGIAVSPAMMAWGHHSFKGHMIQHLVIGMYAPIGLVMGAPLMLVLRTLPARSSRVLLFYLKKRPIRVISHPVTALFLNIGSMYVLYLTPLYNLTAAHPEMHHLLHLHFLLAGCLFTWSVIGPDPVPGRPSFSQRLVVLFFAMASHAYLSKLMYGFLYPLHSGYAGEEIREAAVIMYYWGDLSELIIAFLLFHSYYRRRVRVSLSV